MHSLVASTGVIPQIHKVLWLMEKQKAAHTTSTTVCNGKTHYKKTKMDLECSCFQVRSNTFPLRQSYIGWCIHASIAKSIGHAQRLKSRTI